LELRLVRHALPERLQKPGRKVARENTNLRSSIF
jgi:hypothetical protein